MTKYATIEKTLPQIGRECLVMRKDEGVGMWKAAYKKAREKSGFTLAELLIVVAVIAVLVAIAIPIFQDQLERSREAVDLANLRTAYAECSAEANEGVLDYKGVCQKVTIKQNAKGWKIAGAEVAGVDLKDGSHDYQKGDTVYIIVNLDGSAPTFTTKRPSGTDAKRLF